MFGLSTNPATRPAAPRVARIAPQDCIARHAGGGLTLIDVRDLAELRATGTAAGAVHAPLMRLADKADPRHPDHDPALDPSRPVAVFCASGGRSQMAAEMLVKMGYREVYNLGGFYDWASAGGAVRHLG